MDVVTVPDTNAEIAPNKFKWLGLFVMALAVAIVVIDGTVLNVSQTYIIRDLNTNLRGIQWAVTSYSLVLAALTILGGRIGDVFGRKPAFIIGAIIFAIGSLVTAFAQNQIILVLGWAVIEGIGAALMIPASSALIINNFFGKERGIAFGIYGATAGAASSFGPILGGFFASSIGWRWAFGINVVIAAMLCLGSIVIRDSKHKKKDKIFLDLRGAILSSFGLVSIMYGIIESGKYGWLKAKESWEIFGQSIDTFGISISLISIIIGIILIVAFFLWELRVEKQGKDPLIRVEIFSNPQFSFGIATLSTLFAGFSGLITYGVVFFLLTVRGLSAFESGLALIPFSITSFLISPFSSRLSDKFGAKRIVQIGILINLVGSYLLYNTISYNAQVNDFTIPFIVSGLGFGLIIAQLTNLILSSVPPQQVGVASGVNGTVREIGRSLGVAIIGVTFISILNTNAKINIENQPDIPEELKQSLITNFDKENSVGRDQKSKTDEEVVAEANKQGIKIPSEQAKDKYLKSYRKTESEIKTAINNAITDASKNSLLYTFGFGVLSMLCSFGLPTSKRG